MDEPKSAAAGDKQREKRLSELLMPPPPNVPNASAKNSSQKALQSSPSKKTKPRQDKPIKKKRQSLKQIKESYLTQIAENKKQARGELPQGATYEDFMKWGNLTKEDLREFCEKALNRAELDKAIEALDSRISKNEKKAKEQNARATLQKDSYYRTCSAIKKKERSLNRLTTQLSEMKEAADAFGDIQKFLDQADASAKILLDTVKGSVKVEAERVAKIRANGLKAMQDKTAMLEDYLAYEKIRRGLPLLKKTMNRNETIVWLIKKGREPKDAASKESGENEGVEEQEDEIEIAELPAAEKSDQPSLPSQDSILPESDHELSQFSDEATNS